MEENKSCARHGLGYGIMKEMEVTLFNSNGEFYQHDIINEHNFDEQVAFLGALLSNGWIVEIDNITYTPIKLPDFLAHMHRLKDISATYNYFLPYVNYIQHVKYIQVGDFLEMNQEFQNKIKEAINATISNGHK